MIEAVKRLMLTCMPEGVTEDRVKKIIITSLDYPIPRAIPFSRLRRMI